MGPGGLPSLQNCVCVGDPGAGGFDSHAPSPACFLPLPTRGQAERTTPPAAGSDRSPSSFRRGLYLRRPADGAGSITTE